MASKICTDICLQALSVPRCEQFTKSKAQRKLWVLQCMWKNVYEQLTVGSMGCFLLSALWYNVMKKKDFLSSVATTKPSLSWIKFETKAYLSGNRVWKLGNIA